MILPELNKSKDLLNERKQYMRPIHHEDLVKHEKKYMTDLESKIKQLKKKRDINRSATHTTSKYHSEMIDKIRERELLEQVELKRKIEDRLKIKEKMQLYAKVAMDTHRPVLSLKKKQERLQAIKQLQPKAKILRPSNSASQDRFKNKPWRHNAYINIDEDGNVILKKKSKTRNKNVIKSTHSLENSIRKKPNLSNPYTPPKQKDDYNTKLRIARQQKEDESGVKKTPNIIKEVLVKTEDENIIGDPEEFINIKEKVKVIEEQALLKEKILDSKTNDVEAYGEVNDMLITSIKAKLALLKGI